MRYVLTIQSEIDDVGTIKDHKFEDIAFFSDMREGLDKMKEIIKLFQAKGFKSNTTIRDEGKEKNIENYRDYPLDEIFQHLSDGTVERRFMSGKKSGYQVVMDRFDQKEDDPDYVMIPTIWLRFNIFEEGRLLIGTHIRGVKMEV
jgi:hypothetical protein